MDLKDNFVNFIKKLFTAGNKIRPGQKIKNNRPTSDSFSDSFIIVDDNMTSHQIIMDNLKEELFVNLDKKILKKISNLQEVAYQYDKSGIEKIECSVCLEDNVEFIPLACKHQLCIDCKNKMVDKDFLFCPICKRDMQTVVIYKFIAIISKIKDSHVGIVYYPPIYYPEKNILEEYQIFIDVFYDHSSYQKFVNAITYLSNKKYFVIPNSSGVLDFINSYHIKNINYINELSFI